MANKQRHDLTGGLILIAIGLIILIERFVNLSVDVSLLILPAVGAGFLAWGILTRQSGLIIPGGIVSGIGWGSYLIAGPLNLPANVEEGGVFMLVFGAGFAAITLFSSLFTQDNHWWALIPGAIMAFIGLSVLYGGLFMDVLVLAGKLWPVVLIALGVYTIYQAIRKSQLKEKFIE
jgi:putative Mn2+ efflux pump MntP